MSDQVATRAASMPWTPDGLPGVVLYVGPATRYRRNIHDELKIVRVEAEYTVQRRGARYRAAAGQLIVLHANDAHSGQPTAPAADQWRIICVPSSVVATVVDPATLRFEPPVLADASLSARFRSVFDLFENPASWDERRDALREMVAELVPHADPFSAVEAVKAADAYALEVMRRYLDEHLSSNVSLDELVPVTGMDKFRLVRACTLLYGVAPHALHIRLRLDRARGLIRHGRRLADVGHEVGFYDQAHFTRTFTRAYGITPSRYSAEWRGDGPNRKLTMDA